MKLLFVSQVPDNRLMGVPRVMYCIGDELQNRGHTVHYFFEDNAPPVLFKRIGHLEWSLRAAPAIAGRCRKEVYDAVVITTMSGWALSTFRRWYLPGDTKIISWHHGFEELMWHQMLLEEKHGGHRFSPRFKLYYGGFILWALGQSLKTQDGALFVSSEEAAWVKKQYPAQADTAFYVPNGVAEKYLYPERFDRPPVADPIRLLFTGYWDPWRKGRKYLIETFARLHQEPGGKAVTLTLAGTKLDADEILPDFPEPCRASITVIPTADEADMIRLYREHDIFLLPSLFEGMPLVLLEAMAGGLPCVTTDNNGMADLIEDGENGFLVPRRDTDALVEVTRYLIDNADLRGRLGYAAQRTIKNGYLWPQVADRFIEATSRILAQ